MSAASGAADCGEAPQSTGREPGAEGFHGAGGGVEVGSGEE